MTDEQYVTQTQYNKYDENNSVGVSNSLVKARVGFLETGPKHKWWMCGNQQKGDKRGARGWHLDMKKTHEEILRILINTVLQETATTFMS